MKAGERLLFHTDAGPVWVEPGDEIPADFEDQLRPRGGGDDARAIEDDARLVPEPDSSFSLADATIDQVRAYINGDEDPPARARAVLAWEQEFKRRKTVLSICEKVIADPPLPASQRTPEA